MGGIGLPGGRGALAQAPQPAPHAAQALVCACPGCEAPPAAVEGGGGGSTSNQMLVLMLVATLQLCLMARAQPLCRWGRPPGLGVLLGVGEPGWLI